MKTSVIRQRVADFLKQHVPFDSLSEQDLLDLAGSGKVKFHQSEEYVFRQGDSKGQILWIIQQGRVELLDESDSGERLRDVLGAGDVLGLEQFIGDGSSLYSARTATDVILYGVAAALFESSIARYPTVQRFLSARFSVSGILGSNRTSWLEAEAPPIEFLRSRLVALPADSSTADVLSGMVRSANGTVALVGSGGRATGTITALDLCAGAIARPCPPAVPAPISTRLAVREMLRSRRGELAVTADGTIDSPLEAILTSSELGMFCGHDPARLVREIRQAGSVAEIRPLLKIATQLVLDALAQAGDIDDCCLIGAEVIAAAAGACIGVAGRELETAGIAPAKTPYCWVMFGASARSDLPQPGLPTIAAVYDDSDPACTPEDSFYFTAVAGETVGLFHDCGLSGPGSYWPEGAQPGMPLSEWKRLYSETIRNPIGHDLYARREFFDLLPLSGDLSIFETLREHILFELRDHDAAIALLANDTLVHLPPLTFFRGLVLELDGAQREGFDITEAVVGPLANAARVFAVAKRRVTPVNTLERLENARLDFPAGATILREAADAFRIGLYYQTLTGGSRINPAELGKVDQLLLKNAFSSIQRFLEFTVSTFVPAI